MPPQGYMPSFHLAGWAVVPLASQILDGIDGSTSFSIPQTCPWRQAVQPLLFTI